MKLRIGLVSAVLTMMLSADVARADYTFLFTDSSGNASTSFSVKVGQTVDIRVYLAQTGSTTGLSSTGLDSGGVQLNTSNSSIANVTNVTANPAFDSSSTATGANANVTEHQTISSPVKAPTSGADANRILLGTFTFTGVSAGSTLTVTAIPSTGTNVNVLGDGTVLDSMIVGSSAAITVTAVPEPGSMLLAGLAVAGFGAGVVYRRLRRPKLAAQA
jgi:hypothetical protein